MDDIPAHPEILLVERSWGGAFFPIHRRSYSSSTTSNASRGKRKALELGRRNLWKDSIMPFVCKQGKRAVSCPLNLRASDGVLLGQPDRA
jgi:hypothetical protein